MKIDKNKYIQQIKVENIDIFKYFAESKYNFIDQYFLLEKVQNIINLEKELKDTALTEQEYEDMLIKCSFPLYQNLLTLYIFPAP